MKKGVVIPVALSVMMILLLQYVNAGTVIVQSSASGMSGYSCSESFSGIGDNSTKIKFCSDLAGNYRREQITTTLVGNQECVINTTDVNGKVTITKNCSEISPQELEMRKQEWEKQMNMVTEGDEKLNSLLESQEEAWERQEQEMDKAFEQREKALEQTMQHRDKLWEMHWKAMDRQLERLANFDV